MADDSYAASGVNIEEGDSFSEFAGGICRDSQKNSPFADVIDFSVSHFRGPRGLLFKNLPKGTVITTAPDGVGTKVAIIEAVDGHLGTASNVIAMCAEDIVRWGGVAVSFSSVLDVASLGERGSETNRRARNLI